MQNKAKPSIYRTSLLALCTVLHIFKEFKNYIKIKLSLQIELESIFDLIIGQKSKCLVIHTFDMAVGSQSLS